ncbi:hypothetical protein QE152_g27720 [Popillia japonica]|uniref:Uncharacterized protein n=1 Tax=Popillia japonica TaxID=7064 RepID=A0AAW1JTZ0_POPJA
MMETMQLTMETLAKEMRKEQKEFKQQFNEIREENEKLSMENSELKKRIIVLDDRLERLENEKRRNNVVIQGLTIDRYNQEEIQTKVKQFIENELQVKVKTERVTKLGERTYLMQMESAADKSKVKLKLKRRE